MSAADLQTVADIAGAVRDGRTTARAVAERALQNIEARDPVVNAFTAVTGDRARAEADAIDARRRRGEPLGPLAGVPFAVKNLFDIAGLSTLAGSRLNAERPPASEDAVLVRRLREAGAVLVGALNMDAYAYGFTTENTVYGPTRNPHDPSRVPGGSSGGSAAAVAAGLVPLTLGSDTNGSIRVPASLCGVFGLKPTYGRLPRTGTYPFVFSLDHLGPFATNASDLALAYDALQGADGGDAACAARAVEPTAAALDAGAGRLRVARLTGYFDEWASEPARAASVAAARALGSADQTELPDAAAARAAAFVITAAEGGALHLETLKRRYEDFEPLSRDRLIAGALTPAEWYLKAQRIRAAFSERVRALFERFDVLVAPSTPCAATPIGAAELDIDGRRVPLRANMGLLTQPISFAGLPVAAVPIETGHGLPIGVQLVAAPWREDLCLRAAFALERAGLARCRLGTGGGAWS
jgi:AtzE family amidohydrolase